MTPESTKARKPESLKARLMRALHVEGAKRGLDHEELSALCRRTYGVDSMSKLNAGQMQTLLREWTGHGLKVKRPLPERGYAQRGGPVEMVSGEELETLARAFAARNWGPESQRRFIARQLRGREEIRTRADFHRVFRGVQAMNRRDGAFDDRLSSPQSTQRAQRGTEFNGAEEAQSSAQ